MRESREPLGRAAGRDVRAAPPRRAVLRPAHASSAARFVEAVLHRHAGPVRAASRLGLMLLRPQTAITVQPLLFAPTVHVAPRFRITILRSGPAARRGAHSEPASDGAFENPESRERGPASWRPVLRRALDREAGRHERPIPRRRIAPAVPEKALARRLFARGERRISMLLHGDASVSGAPSTRPVGVPRTVRRTAVPVQGGDAVAASLPGLPAVSDGLSAWSAPSARRPRLPERPGSPITSPAELERLTDEVIRVVDRRIIAQRERMGQK